MEGIIEEEEEEEDENEDGESVNKRKKDDDAEVRGTIAKHAYELRRWQPSYVPLSVCRSLQASLCNSSNAFRAQIHAACSKDF